MPTPDPDTRESSDGATPNGGTYAIAYFRDEHGNPCPKARAAAMEIVEFDANDKAIFRTYMTRPDADVPI